MGNANLQRQMRKLKRRNLKTSCRGSSDSSDRRKTETTLRDKIKKLKRVNLILMRIKMTGTQMMTKTMKSLQSVESQMTRRRKQKGPL